MFERYAGYGFEDFVQDESFVKWVQFPDEQSDQFWNDLQETFPNQRATVRRAIRAIQNLTAASKRQTYQKDSKEIWENLQESISLSQRRRNKWWKKNWIWTAAACLILAGLGYLTIDLPDNEFGNRNPEMAFLSENNTIVVSKVEIEEIVNPGATPLTVVLPDSSYVKLQSKATIRFKKKFDGASRNVHLVGEAFFDVKRDTERPFLVYSAGLITKVLGTSFNIIARKGSDKVTVVVKSGKVSVFAAARNSQEDAEAQGLILRANQQVDYSKKIEKFTRTLIAEPIPVLPPEELQHFTFKNAPVTEIFKALEAAYDTEILFDQDLLSECRLNSDLDMDVNLFEKLDVICEAIDATYKVVDAHIVISGKKCI